jgi:hypothetical protein
VVSLTGVAETSTGLSAFCFLFNSTGLDTWDVQKVEERLLAALGGK